MITTRWWLCVTMETSPFSVEDVYTELVIDVFCIFNSTVIDWTSYIFFYLRIFFFGYWFEEGQITYKYFQNNNLGASKTEQFWKKSIFSRFLNLTPSIEVPSTHGRSPSPHFHLIVSNLVAIIICYGRSQWPRCQRRGSVTARLLGLPFRIPLGEWMFVRVVCY